ncbi:response regulator [Paenibacillus sp. MBLB4367]|uniref:response regulator n=1 Tax=Paenibacillus sp. MBLB4367 TaxID=3384767 RepID=UPI003908303B
MLKVLIVDDDKLVRKGLMLTMPWAEFGMEVVGEANNGVKALEFLSSYEVDLLVTDLEMPAMSGMELMKQVKGMYPHIWMVVLTFHQDFESIQQALRMGAIDYIAKVQLEQERMEEVLGRIVCRIRDERMQGERQSLFYDYEPGRSEYEIATDKPSNDGSLMPVDADMQQLRESWSALFWVTDDAVYEQLLEETKRLRPSVSWLESIFYSAAAEWKRILPDSAIPSIGSQRPFAYWANAVEWLRVVRLELRGKLRKTYSDEVLQSVVKAVSYIREHFNQELRLADASREANMSRSYFSQCFKDIVGQSFNDYVRSLRIAHAEVLLQQTANPIYWVAEQCGYENEKYFSRVFCERIGILPSEYRQRQRLSPK